MVSNFFRKTKIDKFKTWLQWYWKIVWELIMFNLLKKINTYFIDYRVNGKRKIEKVLLEGLKLLASITICQSAGIVGSFFTRASVSSWYANLNKPFFNPPNSVFGPVWGTLYLLMGFSLFLIWRKGLEIRKVKQFFSLFLSHLLINILWSFAFFGCRSPLAGLIVIAILWLAIVWIIIGFFRISRIASILLIPYILWVSFAAILNGYIFFLNRWYFRAHQSQSRALPLQNSAKRTRVRAGN